MVALAMSLNAETAPKTRYPSDTELTTLSSVIEAPPPDITTTKFQQWRVRHRTPVTMAVICAGGFATSLDAVVVGTALPSISSDLNSSTTELAWIGASYQLASCLLMPLWPTISEFTGRKIALIIGFVLFFIGSLVSAVAQGPGMLIGGRIIQGLGAGNTIVLCNVLIADLFPLRERGLYIGIYSAFLCLGAALGPVLGGLLTSYITWRWCFWINLPFIGVALPITAILMDLPKIPYSADIPSLYAVDWLGSTLVIAATTLFLVGLQSGGILAPWSSATVIGLLIGGGVAFALFLLSQRFHLNPIMPPRIFSSQSPAACIAIAFLHGFTYIAFLYYLPFYFQLALGASPVDSGVWLLITAIPLSFVTVGGALLIRKTGRYRPTLLVSAAALTLGAGLSILFPAHRNWALIVVVQLVLAMGIGPLFQAPLLALQASTAREDVSRANGAFAFVRTLSSAIGLVVGQVVLQNELQTRLSQLGDIGLPQSLLDRIADQITVLADVGNLSPVQQRALQTAFTDSLDRLWVVYTATAGAALVATLFVKHFPLATEI
ncbi:hypothetical protein MBLNU230_g7140t1 [Neophaeotheca triangularis]